MYLDLKEEILIVRFKNTMKNYRILIAGADHFISTYLTEKLIILGHDVKTLVRYDYYDDRKLLKYLSPHCRNKIEIIPGSITNPEAINYAVNGVNIILHLSISDTIPHSEINLRDFVTENIIGTLNLLEAAKKYKVQKLVYVSTSDIYGNAPITPTDEEQPTNPISPQIAACIGTEKLVEGYWTDQNLPATIVRLFNPYGPMQSTRAIIPTIISQALVKPNVLLGNMHAERGFTYINDIVDGLLKVVDSEQLIGEKINLGSSIGISIGNLAEKILNIMNKDLEILFDATRIRPESQDVERIVADITKANDVLGWEPRTSIEDGLFKTINWFSQNLDVAQFSERV